MKERIIAVWRSRNREFYRDRAGLGWNIFMPVMLVVGFAFIFDSGPKSELKVGILTDSDVAAIESPFTDLDHIDYLPFADEAEAITKVDRHQIDLLLDPGEPARYWVNVNSSKGYIAERLLLGAYASEATQPLRQTLTGAELRYVDWVMPGVLAMGTMFSALWGVGWVIVRYRKNGVLKRLQATPLTAFEFLVAQVLSRIIIVLGSAAVVLVGADLLLDFIMRGSWLTLALVFTAGGLCFISIGLVVAARLRNEELADGILNLMTWPMLVMSGVWFSLEGTSEMAQKLAHLLPLTHMVDAARGVMIDGASLVDVLPQIGVLLAIALVALSLSARIFRWS